MTSLYNFAENYYLKSKYALFPHLRGKYHIIKQILYTERHDLIFDELVKTLPNNIIMCNYIFGGHLVFKNYPITSQINKIINSEICENGSYLINIPSDVPYNDNRQYCSCVGEFMSRHINNKNLNDKFYYHEAVYKSDSKNCEVKFKQQK